MMVFIVDCESFGAMIYDGEAQQLSCLYISAPDETASIDRETLTVNKCHEKFGSAAHLIHFSSSVNSEQLLSTLSNYAFSG